MIAFHIYKYIHYCSLTDNFTLVDLLIQLELTKLNLKLELDSVFNKNTETLASYITCIRQVATLLGYGEHQVLEVFKNTLSTRLYWVLFPIEDLRLAVETVKRILRKERIDRQLAVQSSSTPFMSIKDGYNSKKVTLDTQDSLDDKVDKLNDEQTDSSR